MRDKLKKEEFFRKSLLFTDECISEFEKILPEIMKQDGTKSQRVINGCNALMVYYIKKVNLEYSLGEEISKVKESYERLLIYYSQAWSMGQGYIELIRILSLGVLLRIDKSQMKTLENKIRQENLNLDYISMKELEENNGRKAYLEIKKKLEDASDATFGQVLTYENKYADALYHEVSIGKTVSSEECGQQSGCRITRLHGCEGSSL